MDKDLNVILEETLKLCQVLMNENSHFIFAFNLSKAILAYQLRLATKK